MFPRSAEARLRRALAGAVAAALLASCGKKAPLRLPEDRPAERAATPRVLVREGRASLAFAVPAHRVFPEREPPWVLARVLRRDAGAADFVEAGSILEPNGFAFEAPLSWSDDRPVAGPVAYRVEFRDARRSRRALSEAVEAPAAAAGAPRGLRAAGGDLAVRLTWSAPEGGGAGLRYRVYRREAGQQEFGPLGPAAAAEVALADTRALAGREYCYVVRAVAGTDAAQAEGPASEEACARAEDTGAPPAPAAVRASVAGTGIVVSWDPVAAPDLAGYRVYRAVEDGPLLPLTPAAQPGTVFRDELGGVAPGARLRYAVTATDAAPRPNESPLSGFAEARAPLSP